MFGPPVAALVLPADPRGAAGRWLRSTAFAAVSVLLAATAHRLAGDALPRWWVLAGAGGVLSLVGNRVAGRERGAGFLVAATVGTQLALHTAFALAMNHGGAAMSAMPMTGSGNPAMDPLLASARAWCGGAPTASMSLLPAVGWMLAGHLIAAAVVGCWLRLGEKRFFDAAKRWGSLTGARLQRTIERCAAFGTVAPRAAPTRRQPRPTAFAPARLRPAPRVHGHLARRGPPLPAPC